MKKLINDKRWGPILVVLGNIAALEFLIFPGLTLANTFINILSVFGFIAMFLFDLNYIKETFFTEPEVTKKPKRKPKTK
jgi:hypothetical protein